MYYISCSSLGNMTRANMINTPHLRTRAYSGHNKWSKIRHAKGAIDAERARLFSRLIKDINVNARLAGFNPVFNIKLAASITAAKAADMPKSKIEAALKRASGLRSTAADTPLEHVTYEATLGLVGLIIETLTDKRTRTIANVKNLVKKAYVSSDQIIGTIT